MPRIRLRRGTRAALAESTRSRQGWHGVDSLATIAVAPFTVASDLDRVAADSRRLLTFRGERAHGIDAEVYAHLAPVKRYIWGQRAIAVLVRGVVLVAILYLIAAVAWFAAMPLSRSAFNTVAVIVALWTLAIIVTQRTTFFDSARVTDRLLGLNQTLGTAVELINQNAEGRLIRLQLRRAAESLRAVETSRVIPIGLPRRDLVALAAVVLAIGLFLFLATLNLRIPGSIRSDELTDEPLIDSSFEIPAGSGFFDATSSDLFDAALFDSALDGYITDLEGQNLTPEEIAQRVAEAQAILAQRAEALNRQRQALGELADALGDSSTTTDAADSIRRGDYSKAAQQLRDLGAQSTQLSARARRDLAQRMTEAARRAASMNPDLAARLQKAAQNLAADDQSATRQSFAELADAVEQAGEQIRQLSSSSQAFDPNEMSAGEGAFGELSQEDLGALAEYEGQDQSEGDAGGDEFGDATGAGVSDGSDPNGAGASTSGRSLGSGEGSAGSGGGQAPSRESYQAPDRTRAAQGRVVELRGRPSAGGTSTLEESEKVPLVSSNDGSITGAAGQSRTVIVDPVSVRAEQNFVPLEKRQVVRDFFSGMPLSSGTGATR
ncbi:MAG: hypothetical protein EPO26_04590 [Chloroflexota bacterium]|nr:MAG: hypothetical protein EPO26_04590 [Chloroflexota bacterium]